ncbi:MAG TPA: hypothetical protein VKU41_27850 [Polyangiaceae bacterium]|nr:hypothetical protein [Polyangiaceae bacterium]
MTPPEPELSDAERLLVAATCERRAELELRGAAAFTVVTQALVDLRADARIVDLSARAIAEEIRHSNIYFELASTFARRALRRPAFAPIDVPAHDDVDPTLRRVLHVVGMCSINETMACAFLELCLAGAKATPVRAALREVLSDEIRHARVGWAYLASPGVAQDARHEVGRRLVPMLCAQLEGWWRQVETLPAGAVPAYGCPAGAAIAEATLRSLDELVLPGFEALGIDAAEARRYSAGHAPCPACGKRLRRPA